MSYISDCRTDENYNQKYLNDKDAEFVAGYDWCRIMSVENFFDNMETYEADFDIDGEDINLVRFLDNHPNIRQALIHSLLHWIESERDELIISMVENMDDTEFEKTKEDVDAGQRENCLATYQFEKDDQANWEE